jgi:hypothetical protein
MLSDIDRHHPKKIKIAKGIGRIEIKQNIKCYAHNGARFDAYLIL